MAYRKTEKLLAALAARRASIIAAAIDVIRREGIEAVTVNAVCKRGKFFAGLIYKDFPDMTKLHAATMAMLLDRDLTELRPAAGQETGPVHALAAALAVIYTRWDNARLVQALMASAIYRRGIIAELERLLHRLGLKAVQWPPQARGARFMACMA
jgi:AcrR family transcriptional regulator